MRLKSLELSGFKSFADRTEFSFEHGVTGIVGPNGCGKSNVVDALKWILGEQSAKSLRGTEMADVIFDGTDHRKALPYAEVALAFWHGGNGAGEQEIRISRRVYRTGEGEYRRNGEPCRLRDIKEIFLDTGSSLDSFSIAEQGRIDAILSASPEERRGIFEEAAGVSRLKAKKRESLAKLARAGENLERLRAVLQEIERSLRSVRVQAGKARSYQALVAEQREKRLQLLLRQRADLLARVRALREAREARARERDGASEALERAEIALAEAEARLEAARAAREAAEREGIALEGRIAVESDRLGRARARFSEFEGRIAEACRRAAEASARQGERGRAVEARSAALAAAEAAEAEASLREEEARGRAEDAEAAIREVEAAAADARRRAFDAGEAAARAASEAAAARSDEEAASARVGRSRDRLSEVEGRIAALEADCRRAADQAEEYGASYAALQRELSAQEEAAAAVAAARARIGEAWHKASERRAALASRLELLEDLERRREGVGSAARAVLERGRDRVPGVVGVLADLLEVRFEDARAVEALLAENGAGIVVGSAADALAGAAFLREAGEGKALFLPLAGAAGAGGDPPPAPDGARRALDAVESAPEVRPLLERILGRAFLVPDLAAAATLAAAAPAGTAFATPVGEGARSGGGILGGGEAGAAGPLTRRMEIRRLRGQLREAADTISRLEEDLGEQERRAAWIDQELKLLRTRSYEEAVLRQEAEGSRKAAGASLASAQDERRVLRSEIEEAGRALEEARARRLAAERSRAERDAERQAMEARLGEAASRREALEAERSEAGAAHTEARVAHAEARSRGGAARSALAEARRAVEEGTRALAALASDTEEARAAREAAAREIEEVGLALDACEGTRRRLAADRGSREAAEGEARAAREAGDGSVRAARESLSAAEASLGEARAAEAAEEGTLRGLAERAREDLEADLEALAAGRPAGETLPPEGEIRQALETLKRKIEHMGQVNQNAIAEQEELEARLQTLGAQEQDVQKAKTDLEAMIQEINRVSRERFEKAFAAIREHFHDVFRKLFGGGKADILLEEGQDVLEAGVEIVARPPGKELRTISLLSGGEKTLTTLALLFAVFRTHPFPFTVLDEVDAALDESNIDRFLGMLKEFARTSQFIVVTHSKKTMAAADVLYGVTMPEAGVSRKVEVRLEEVERVVGEPAAAPA